MSWGNWILAYLFDCVHPHTTWPRRHRTGFTYVSCLDCGRELPYSLERMKILTRKELVADRKRHARNRPWHSERYARQGRASLPHSLGVCWGCHRPLQDLDRTALAIRSRFTG